MPQSTEPATWPRRALWTMSGTGGTRCGGRLPLLPRATDEGGRVAFIDPGGFSWSWTAPGSRAGPIARPGRTCADVELRSWGKGGRRVAEAAECAALAETCPAVTSHGYAPSRLAEQLRQFSRAGRVGHPQVYPPEVRSTDALTFLRRCLATWRRLGFDGPTLVPILDLSAGEADVLAWVGECDRQGLDWHLWRLGHWSGRWDRLVGGLLPEPADAPPAT